MGNAGRWDLTRQAANVVGAVFQIGMTVIASGDIREVTGERIPLAEPALYAFSIWALIFALSLAYAAYQALPINRENLLLRRVGWFTAVAFACTGLWSVFVPARQLLLALAMLLAIFACLTIVYLRVADAARGRTLSRGECWLVALPVGIFLGWITAANAVSLTSEPVRLGLVGAGGTGEALLGAALLLLGGLMASAVSLAGKTGPPQGYLAYGATVLWALTAVVVNQYDASLLTTAAAALSAALIVLVLVGVLRRDWPRREAGRTARPDVSS